MISSATITSGAGAAKYHEAAFGENSKDGDNYYAQETVESAWHGKGAVQLGLEGEKVTREEFINVLEGKLGEQQLPKLDRKYTDKSTGEIKETEHRAGWDFTVSAPKSVSIMGIAGGDERILTAHDSAVLAAMSYLEGKAQTRVSVDGEKYKVATESLIYASFKHYTNRENESQLHTHNVIANATFDKETGKWRALTNDEIFKERAFADKIYQNMLGTELTKLGYKVDIDKNGRVDIVGIPKELREALSTRTKQIEAEHQARGTDAKTSSWSAKEAAKLSTRAEKVELPREEVAKRDNEKAMAFGVDLKAMVEASKSREAEAKLEFNKNSEKNAVNTITSALKHLSSNEAAFTQKEILTFALQFSGASRADFRQIVAAFTSAKKEGQIQEAPNGLFTTPEAVRDVRVMIDAIKNGENHRAVMTSEKEFQKELKAFNSTKDAALKAEGKYSGKSFQLSAEQTNAARAILMGKDQISGVQGSAGTGKTAALEFVNVVAKSKGWDVVGLAPSNAAVIQLEKDSGIKSHTLQSFVTGTLNKNAINAIQQQINHIELQIAGKAGGKAHIAVTTFGVGFKDMYSFSKNGDVFKTSRGLFNPVSTISHAISDKAGSFLGADKIDSSQKMMIGWQSENKYQFTAEGSVLKASNHFMSSSDPYAMRQAERGEANLREAKNDWKSAGTFGQKIGAATRMATSQIDKSIGKVLIKHVQVKSLEKLIAHVRSSKSVHEAKSLSAMIHAATKVALSSMVHGTTKEFTNQVKVTGLEAIAAKANWKISLVNERAELIKQRNLIESGNNGKTLYVLDEAGMAGQKDVTSAIKIIQEKSGKFVMQGDIKQHGSVPAGAAFKDAQEAGMPTSHITVVMRQTAENVVGRAAVAEGSKKEGSMSAAIGMLTTTEIVIKEGQSKYEHKSEQYKVVAGRYMAVKTNLESKYEGQLNKQTVGIVTPLNADREGINKAIRAELKDAGKLDMADVSKEVYTRTTLSPEQLKVAANYDVGQKMVAEKDISALGLKKGEAVTIKDIDQSNNKLTVEKADGKTVELNPSKLNDETLKGKNHDFSTYISKEKDFAVGDKISVNADLKDGKTKILTNGQEATIKAIDSDSVTLTVGSGERSKEISVNNDQFKSMDHGYVKTSFKEQGATNQAEIVYAPSDAGKGVNREMGYVAITRAREHTEIITDNKDKALGLVDKSSEKTSAIDVKAEVASKANQDKSKEASTATPAKEKRSTHEPQKTSSKEDLKQVNPDKSSEANHVTPVIDRSSEKTSAIEVKAEVASKANQDKSQEANTASPAKVERSTQESLQSGRRPYYKATAEESKLHNQSPNEGSNYAASAAETKLVQPPQVQLSPNVNSKETTASMDKDNVKHEAKGEKSTSKPTNPTLSPANNPAVRAARQDSNKAEKSSERPTNPTLTTEKSSAQQTNKQTQQREFSMGH